MTRPVASAGKNHGFCPYMLPCLLYLPSSVAPGGVDNALHGRPRDTEFPCDRRRLQAGLEGGEDQLFLSRSHRCAAAGSRRSRRCRPGRNRLVGLPLRRGWPASSVSRRRDRSRSAGRAIPGFRRPANPVADLPAMDVSSSISRPVAGPSRYRAPATGRSPHRSSLRRAEARRASGG